MGENTRGCEAVDPRHVDVEKRNVWMVSPGSGGHLITAPDGCYYLEVLLRDPQPPSRWLQRPGVDGASSRGYSQPGGARRNAAG